MKLLIYITIVLFSINPIGLFSQTPPKNYAHKVAVDSVFQTKAYTYLKVTERIKEKDSIQWIALPIIPAKPGDIYYFESGMAMGQFTSKELTRTFSQIIFLGGISTTLEVDEKTIIPPLIVDTTSKNTPPPVVHTVEVKEVLPAGAYTYLRVLEDKKEQWLAIVKIPAKVGQIFHYDDYVLMTDFYSRELKRTFKEILFLSKLSPGPGASTSETINKSASEARKYNKAMSQPAKVVNSIADLLENKKLYIGKKIIIKGEVTKYSSNILDKNWVHIKDGTSFIGKSDLVLTTDKTLKIGDKVTFEGIISADKDFGNGYFFEVIIEDAKVKE